VRPKKTKIEILLLPEVKSYERTFPPWPATVGAIKPGSSVAENSCVGLPRESAALTQPEPNTSAT